MEAVFWSAVDALTSGDESTLRRLITVHEGILLYRPEFGEGYFANPTLLHFVAENPIRTGKLPPNVVSLIELMLTHGAEVDALCGDPPSGTTLGLVVTGRVPRESGMLRDMVGVLVAAGASLEGLTDAAIGQGEVGALDILLERGAPRDLTVCAALGDLEGVRARLPGDALERQRALAGAVIHRQAIAIEELLANGTDPNAFNPAGFHSHATPLHLAAFAGDLACVEALLAGGADRLLPDKIWQGTARGWAEHGGHRDIAARLA